MGKKEEIHILNQDYSEVISNINDEGNVYFDAGKYDEALACFEKSLHLKTIFLGEVHLDVADSYNNIGNTYYYKGLYDKALDSHFKSKQIKTQLLGKDNIVLASTYNGIGICYDAQGFYSKALAYYNKSLDLRSRYLGKDNPSVAQNYNNLGLCYFSTRLFDNALIYLNQALQIRQQHYGVEHASVAQTLLNIGACFYQKQECDEALYYYEKSLKIRKVIYGNKHPNITTALNNIGLCFSCKNQYKKALAYHYEALDIRLRTLGQDHPSLANIYRDTANCLCEMRDFDGALNNLQKALQIVIPGFSPKNNIQNPPIQQYLDAHILLEILQSKAACLQKMHEKQVQEHTQKKYGYQALKTYQLAAKLVEQIRRGYEAESTHLTLAEKAHQMYEAAIETAISNGVVEMAFTFAEQGKGMVLLSSLKDIDARLAANIPEKWLQEADDLKVRLTELDTAIRRERNQIETKRNKEGLRVWQNQHFDYQRKYESLIERLEGEFPNYFQLKYDVHTIDLQDLQQSLEEEMAMVEFFVGSKQTYIWVIGRHFVLKEKIVLTERELSEKVEDLIEAIYAENDKEYRKWAHELYALLLEKCLSYPFLENIQNLQIIPDGNLNFLPFEVLLMHLDTSNKYNDLAYLVRRFAISYHYSSTLWQYGKRKESSEIATKSNFVGFAPVYLSEQPQTEKMYAPLLHSVSEITTIKKAFQQKGHNVAAYLHLEASKRRFRNQAANYKYVHIAAHAFSQSHFGQDETYTLDGIVFSSQKNGTSNVLTMAEIYNLTLRADLVVLSCCDSGIGKIAKGEGVMAINRGFLYAGAKNVIYTLFKVYDQQSAELMQYLYEEILEEKPYGIALQAAKFKMISQNLAPKYWSGFVHIGG